MDGSFFEPGEFFADSAVTTDDIWTAPKGDSSAEAFFAGVVPDDVVPTPAPSSPPSSEAFFAGVADTPVASPFDLDEPAGSPLDGSELDLVVDGLDVSWGDDASPDAAVSDEPEVVTPPSKLDGVEPREEPPRPPKPETRTFALDDLSDLSERMGLTFED